MRGPMGREGGVCGTNQKQRWGTWTNEDRGGVRGTNHEQRVGAHESMRIEDGGCVDQ